MRGERTRSRFVVALQRLEMGPKRQWRTAKPLRSPRAPPRSPPTRKAGAAGHGRSWSRSSTGDGYASRMPSTDDDGRRLARARPVASAARMNAGEPGSSAVSPNALALPCGGETLGVSALRTCRFTTRRGRRPARAVDHGAYRAERICDWPGSGWPRSYRHSGVGKSVTNAPWWTASDVNLPTRPVHPIEWTYSTARPCALAS